jgi:dihydrofolate synthase/folylpolyglutamate synthase
VTQSPKHSTSFQSFQEAVDFLEKAIDYEKRTAVKYTDKNFNIGRTEALLEYLGNPHRAFPLIHVAGTKGKGTTAALLESCLRKAGFRTGLHTSPHLVSVCERMLVNGAPATEDEFCRLLSIVRDYVTEKRYKARDTAPTYFEITTSLSFKHFQQKGVEWAVIETGLGGRLDSTNVVLPECAVITAIGFDHMDKLGDTIEKIAGEKAGIFKTGVPVVLASQTYPAALEVLRRVAEDRNCPRWEVGREVKVLRKKVIAASPDDAQAQAGWKFDIQTPVRTYRDLFCPLLGAHQVQNCATAVAVLDMLAERGRLNIAPQAVRDGLASCRWPARVELLRRAPPFILDAAHTVESVQALLEALDAHFPARPVRFVFGCSHDKNWRAMLKLLAPRAATLFTTQSKSPRATDSAELAAVARELGMASARSIASPVEAVREALSAAQRTDVVCVTGSFFVAGEVRKAWSDGEL